ncbi:TRAP transporter small permease [Ornithinimicrobium cavernae]|uniref:TRAP transporter small permease n=1 Tax=Ornithinimicrobium cavernae TaxID=2666047 RepID=UPI001F3A32F3|nr:TRAP transporter small permease [Ornithinimicrobium cavernae]
MSTDPTAQGADDASPDEVSPGPVRWQPLMAVLRTVRRVVDRILAGLCIVIFTALVVIVAWQVFTREIGNYSAPWTEEAARYTFVVLALVAAAYVFSERGHIAVEMLVERLPQRGQLVMGVLIELIVIAFTLFTFVWGGWRISQNAWEQQLSTLPVTVGQIYLVMPLAGVLITFYSVYYVLGILAGAERPTPELDENAEAI